MKTQTFNAGTAVVLPGILAVVFSAWFSGCPKRPTTPLPEATQLQPKIVVEQTRNISEESYVIGLKLGWSVGVRGGTHADIDIMIRALKDNRPELITQWFESH